MVEGGDCLSLAVETIRELLMGEFDCDGALHPGVASFPDLAHAAGADARDEARTARSGSRVLQRPCPVILLRVSHRKYMTAIGRNGERRERAPDIMLARIAPINAQAGS